MGIWLAIRDVVRAITLYASPLCCCAVSVRQCTDSVLPLVFTVGRAGDALRGPYHRRIACCCGQLDWSVEQCGGQCHGGQRSNLADCLLDYAVWSGYGLFCTGASSHHDFVPHIPQTNLFTASDVSAVGNGKRELAAVRYCHEAVCRRISHWRCCVGQ
jgi:hypothetical protein